MMLHTCPEPRPLTRTNVTQHDKIWEKESPFNYLGLNISELPFSPPLKHITPDTAKELWENFDPLDALDSGSDSSCDTMIMMNTEEELRNELSIQRSNQSYEQRNFQHDKSYKYSLGRTDILPTLEEDDVTIDEGYGTDNRTNTSASISSPLSSSLSSLSTSESSSSNGSLPRQNGQMSRQQQITSNGRITLNNRSVIPVRKVMKSNDYSESSQSLEERLRALTTIEEEDTNSNSDQEKTSRPQTHRGSFHNRDFRHSNRNSGSVPLTNGPTYNSNGPIATRTQNGPSFNTNGPIARQSQNGPNFNSNGQIGRQLQNGPVQNRPGSISHDPEGVFHAVPVQIGQQSHKMSDNRYPDASEIPTSPSSRQEWINRVEKMGYVPHSDVKYYDTLWNDKNIQMGMSEKCSDGKRIPVLDEDVNNDLLIKPKQSHMVSMPDLRYDRPHNQPVVYVNDTPVKMRQKPPTRRERYSWDYNNISAQNELANQIANMESCDSPKLQDQLRAMSELSLGIKKPLYASSADIYKLFQGQGQGQYGLPQGRKTSHRHSFHAMPSSQTWMQNAPQSNDDVKMRLRSASTSNKVPSMPPKKPMRVSYGQGTGYEGENSPIRDMPSFANSTRTVPQSYLAAANKKDSKLSTLV